MTRLPAAAVGSKAAAWKSVVAVMKLLATYATAGKKLLVMPLHTSSSSFWYNAAACD